MPHPVVSRIKEAADKWGFVAQTLGLPVIEQ